MRIVALYDKVARGPPIDAPALLLLDFELRKTTGFSLELRIQCVDVIQVDMCISYGMREAPRN